MGAEHGFRLDGRGVVRHKQGGKTAVCSWLRGLLHRAMSGFLRLGNFQPHISIYIYLLYWERKTNRGRVVRVTNGTLHHPSFGAVRYSVSEVPTGGDGQTAAVIGMMKGYVEEDARHPIVVEDLQRALSARPDLPAHEAIFWWVKDRVRFVRDEDTVQPWQRRTNDPVVEALIRPADMVAMCGGGASCQRVGDCDDFSMYTAALLTAAGIRAAFATVAASAESTDFSHVYVVAYPGGVRVPLDTSHGAYPGWETNQARRIQEWPVGGGGWITLVALAALGVALCR